MTDKDTLSEEAICAALPAGIRRSLRRFDVFSTIDSTNRWLCRQDPPPDSALDVAIADFQSQGRGRRGRSWEIPAGYGLCLSIARSIALPPQRVAALTLALGVAVAEALEQLGATGIGLKWPNDLVLHDGKLGGILCEIAGTTAHTAHVVTGVGINVRLPANFAPPGERIWGKGAVALSEVLDPIPSRNRLAASVISSVASAMESYEAGGLAPFLDRWRGRDWLQGAEIAVRAEDADIEGIAGGIDEEGALLLDTPNGQSRVFAGDILRYRRSRPMDVVR